MHLHRAFGCYGILESEGTLVVIDKNGGPYTRRFDLPGGSLDGPEALAHCVLREVHEECGLNATIVKQLGTVSFDYPWTYQRYDHNQHLCVFYRLEAPNAPLLTRPTQFIGQDSLGAKRLPLVDLTVENSSPLVLWVKDYLQSGHIDLNARHYPHWEVKA